MKEVAYTLDVKPGTVAFHKLAVGKTAPELIGEFCRLGNEPPFYQKPRLSAKAEGRHRLRSHRRLNFSRMNRPFASFEFLNRGLDIRLLEASSLRKIYVFLLLDVFMLGACTFHAYLRWFSFPSVRLAE